MNFILIMLSGILTAVSFPTVFGDLHLPNLGFLAWFSLAPLFYVTRNSSPRKAFLLTFATAAIYYSISLYWLYTALNTFGHLTVATSVAVLMLLIIFLAAYISLAPALASWIEEKTHIKRFWTLPVFWVACEFARNYVPCNGFPWGNITNTQYAYLPIIQIVDLVGVYGLTFVMIVVNLWFSDRPKFLSKQSIFTTSLFLSVVVYGFIRIGQVEHQQENLPSIRVALLQGNIPQDEKWRKGLEDAQIEPYQQFTRTLKDSGARLIIWPEATYSWPIPESIQSLPKKELGLDETSEKNGRFVLMGGVSTSTLGGERTLHNSMFLFDDNGEIVGRYHKKHLVPFGEYVPARKMLFFISKLVTAVGDFAAGAKDQPLLYTDDYQLGGLICYEDLFPEISRHMTAKGANFLAAITNDAWYGRSSAALQHLAISVFRSVENRRWMTKSANTGISAVIDEKGQIISKTGIFERGMIVSNVKLDNRQTIYTRFGDFFAWGCVLMVIGLVGYGFSSLRVSNPRTHRPANP